MIAGEMAALHRVQGEIDLKEPTLVAADERQGFRTSGCTHLWLAPVLVVVRASGLHWNHAFTIVNIALLTVFASCALSTLGTSATVLLACSPIIWWIDKAHIEVFNFAVLGTALVLCRKAPQGSPVARRPDGAKSCVRADPRAGSGGTAVDGARQGPPQSRRCGPRGPCSSRQLHPAYCSGDSEGRPSIDGDQLQLAWVDGSRHADHRSESGLCWWFPGLLVTLAISHSAKRSRRARSSVLRRPPSDSC